MSKIPATIYWTAKRRLAEPGGDDASRRLAEWVVANFQPAYTAEQWRRAIEIAHRRMWLFREDAGVALDIGFEIATREENQPRPDFSVDFNSGAYTSSASQSSETE